MFDVIMYSLLALAFYFFRAHIKSPIALVALIAFPLFAFADDAVTGAIVEDPNKLPAYIGDLITWLSTLELGQFKVGVYVVLAIKWIGLVAGIFTAVSLAVSGLLTSLAGVLSLPVWVSEKIFPSAPEWAHKLSDWAKKVIDLNAYAQKFLKYFSAGNSSLAAKK